MASSKSSKAKAAWAKARRYAQEQGISVSEARSQLARQVSTAVPPVVPRPSARTKKPAVVRPAKHKELRLAEQELRTKYPHIIEGTLRIEADGAHKGRRSVEIACQGDGCQQRRRIHTSDAFQTKLCLDCTTRHRKQRRAKANRKGAS